MLEFFINDKIRYQIINLGVKGKTAQKNGDNPYWNEKEYH